MGVQEDASEVVAGGAGHDSPVHTRESDDLGRWPLARAIYRTIKMAPAQWSTRIGLYGAWGNGKTSVLNFIEVLAKAEGDLVLSFSAWSATGEKGVLELFSQELRKALPQPPDPTRKAQNRVIAKNISQASKFLEKAGTLSGVPVGLISAGVSKLSDYLGEKCKFESGELAQIVELLAGRKVIVFIDDLDRADPKAVPKALLALRELLDWPGFAFVMAFDQKVVAAALGEYSKSYGENAQHFLEKIIDIPFELPAPTKKQISKMASRALEQCCGDFIPEKIRSSAAPFFPSNPRQAKHIARLLGILGDVAKRHDKDELDWLGIILQTILRVAAPQTAAIVEASIIGNRPIGGHDYDDEDAAKKNVQKDSPSARVTTALKESGAVRNSPTWIWLDELIRAIGDARRYGRHEKAEYEMQLITREPCMTRKELELAIAGWEINDKNQTSLNRALLDRLEEGADRANVSIEEAFVEFVSAVVSRYSSECMEKEREAPVAKIKAQTASAEKLLSLLEFLWSDENFAEVDEAIQAIEPCKKIFSAFRQNVARGDGLPSQFRMREKELLKRVIDKCESIPALYFETELNIQASVRSQNSLASLSEVDGWLNEVRQLVFPAVMNLVGGCFHRSGGIAGIGDSRVEWLLTASSSPVYQDAACSQVLMESLSRRPEDFRDQEVLSQNALDYLDRVARVNYSNSGEYVSLASVAWSAAILMDPDARKISDFQYIYENLLKGSGVARPNWLAAESPDDGEK